MHLYTDDNPSTTVTGLGYKNADVARRTIQRVEHYFDKARLSQSLPGFTPKKYLPRRYLTTAKQANRYYRTQKKYRILGMCNRAKGSLRRSRNSKQLRASIRIFKKWLTNDHSRKY